MSAIIDANIMSVRETKYPVTRAWKTKICSSSGSPLSGSQPANLNDTLSTCRTETVTIANNTRSRFSNLACNGWMVKIVRSMPRIARENHFSSVGPKPQKKVFM